MMMNVADGGLVKLKTALQILQISKSSFYAGIKAGRYPCAVRIGPRTSRWRLDDIRLLVAKGADK